MTIWADGAQTPPPKTLGVKLFFSRLGVVWGEGKRGGGRNSENGEVLLGIYQCTNTHTDTENDL